MRDLGAHMSTTSVLRGGTLTKRFREATSTANRLARTSTSQRNKTTVVRTKVLPKALYGSEVQPIADQPMAALRSAILKAVGPRSARRSVDLAMLCAAQFNNDSDMDPLVQQLVRKVRCLRRFHAKHSTRNCHAVVTAHLSLSGLLGDAVASHLLPDWGTCQTPPAVHPTEHDEFNFHIHMITTILQRYSQMQ